MGYHQLTEKQRYQLETYLALGKNKSEIAKLLRVHRSTVYREIKRNTLESNFGFQYDAIEALGISQGRRQMACESRVKVRGDILKYIRKKLKLGWSPEQIAGRMRLEKRKVYVSYSSIYRFIQRDYCDYLYGEGLVHYLRWGERGKRKGRRVYRLPLGANAPRRSIRERPEEATQRRKVGHFERDLMEGKRGKAALLVMTDRKSRLTLLDKVKKRDAKQVHKSTVKIIKKRLRKIIKSSTNDNGHEFIYSRLPRIEKELGVPVYFTDPSAPWQRGTVENAIGLLRQFFPKGCDLSKATQKHLRIAEKLLNNRPRKILSYQTPFEVFNNK